MAKMCTKDCFVVVLIFLNLRFPLFTCGETISSADIPVIALNREQRDLVEELESPRNLKVFDFGAEFHGANHTVAKEDLSNVVVPLKDKGGEVKISDVSASTLSALTVCLDLQAELGSNVAEFVQCSIMHARPITVCLNCTASYNSTVHAYQQVIEASQNGTKCKDVLFGKDKLEIVQTMYKNVLNLWSQANCDTCYAMKNGSPDLSVVSNQTLNFIEVLKQVRDCFESIRSLNVKVNDTSNDTCSQCKPLYKHLDGVYLSIVADLINDQPTEQVCADIADAMNITRHLWNYQFKCKVYGTEVGYAMFVLTVSLSALPVLFYLASKVLSNAETIHLVLPKRKFQDSMQLQR